MIRLILLLMITTGHAQQLFVNGTIMNEQGSPLPSVSILIKGTTKGAVSNLDGIFQINVPDSTTTLQISAVGFLPQEILVGHQTTMNIVLKEDVRVLEEVVVSTPGIVVKSYAVSASVSSVSSKKSKRNSAPSAILYDQAYEPASNTESYTGIEENGFHRSVDQPLSTFSIDVDPASYSNVRRFLNMGQMPPKDAVRIEEMINYFHYDYDGPTDEHPFAIDLTKTKAPWNEAHLLVKVGIQGQKLEMDQLPPSNIVFLIDVSGSMNEPNKLPLLKSSLKMLTNELRPEDQIAMVVYAGAAGLVLQPTPGNEKEAILNALENLQAGGSTAGGAGIRLAYEVAQKHFVKDGNNRVILATDGDFNVGASSDGEMQRLIEEKRKEGVFLTVLGFGMGNYKDSKMETLADKGNGNYAYIDNIMEAKKVLVTEFGGTLFTIAKDVKIQVEFNPGVVQAYRLIGYENRRLNDEDFNDDQKDAGELGSGHTVTALYEIIPVGMKSKWVKSIDDLKYQKTVSTGSTQDLLTVKFRYKAPDGDTSRLIEKVLKNDQELDNDANLKWAAAVAGFGMLLRDSEYKGNLTYQKVVELAKSAKGDDDLGYRAEFINLAGIASKLQ